jgi:pimeloyl-ACP methyl ester carboxylesterase
VCLRTACIAVTLCFLLTGTATQGQEPFKSSGTAVVENASHLGNRRNCQIIYLGFVGALEPPGNKHSGVVQIRQTLQGKEYPDVCANSFSPYVWMEGRDWLMRHFPAHAGALTPQELQDAPKLILVGHSMGGWAMMSVARELRSRNIPVELTVQVDSVGITDYTIPRNVKAAAIFHANDALMFLTTKHLRREDPSRTTILENVTVAGAGHESITRDPRIRQLVMDEVERLRMGLAVTRSGAAGPEQK